MKTITKAFLVLSMSAVFGVVSSYSQTTAKRFTAEIPFDFAIGNKVFQAGRYSLAVIRRDNLIHTVQLRDGRGKLVCNTPAVQSGRSRERVEMVFARTDDRRQLERLSTPEFGYIFSSSGGDKRVAVAERISVPASTTGPN